jgi:sec-independent protein translocase protein TatB
MFGIGTTELLVILVVALVVLGPKKLPQAAKSLGKAFGEFKRVSTDVKRTIDVEVDRLEKEDRDKKARDELRGEDAKTGKAPEKNKESESEPEAGEPEKEPERETADAGAESSDTGTEEGQDMDTAGAEMHDDDQTQPQDTPKA